MSTISSAVNFRCREAESLASLKHLIGFLLQGFFYSTAVGAVSLLIPLYALHIGSNTFELGLITGSRGMGHFLLVVPVGLLLDRFGIRNVFILSSFATFFVLLAIPAAERPLPLLLLACAEGLACSTRLTSLNARSFKILSFLKPSQTGWYKGISSTGGTIAGPVLGAFLSERLGYMPAFAGVAAIVLFANLLELAFGPRVGVGPANKGQQERFLVALKGLSAMFRNRTLLFASYGESLGAAFNSSSRILLILLIVESMHNAPGSVSLVTSMIGVAYLAVVFLCGFVTNYLRPFASYTLSAAAVIVSLAVMAFTHDLVWICAAALLAGAGQGILSLSTYKTISRIKGDNGKVAGIVTFSTGLTLCIAPMLTSSIVDLFGLQVGFLTLLFPFLLLPFLYLLFTDPLPATESF